MSGIVAIFDRGSGTVQREDLHTMLDSIDHRGPDGSGSWYEENVGLGHQQLHSTPESETDSPPIQNNNVVVAADLRLDNRDHLLQSVEHSRPESAISDTQLLSMAYRKWGTKCLDHLIGAFAFVIWDMDENTVFCARDHLGVKPLYYYCTDDVFVCASEPKAILTLSFVPKSLNEIKVGDFLVGRFGDKSNTYFKNVERLPPAHASVVGAESRRKWQYWDLDPSREIRLGSDAAYERRFRELFEQAVQCRLRSNGPVGTTLSGGLDSSSIAVMARSLLSSEEPLHTFSWVFDEAPTSDEREYIESITNQSGISSHYLSLDDIGVLVDEDEVFDHLDEPPHNSMHYAWWETAKQGVDSDIKVLLDGALGDSAVSYGYGLLPDLFRTLRWKQLIGQLRHLSDRNNSTLQNQFIHRTVKPLVPDPLVRRHQAYRGTPVLEARLNPTISPEFASQLDLRARCKDLYEGGWTELQTARQQQYQSIWSGLLTSNFEMLDMRGAFFGIEPRHPFADVRLLEFSLAIPADQQLKDGLSRSIIRRSIDDLLPEKIRRRAGKTPVSEGFWNALSKETEDLEHLLTNPGPIEKYVDWDALRSGYDRFVGDEPVNAHEARALWKTLSLSKWFEAQGLNIEKQHGSDTATHQ